jgi:flavin reductase (DIM6/NTAB) family NADH-FMN oxidoreductase RutF
MKMHQSLESCYAKSGSNADRFADCVLTSNKKISDIVEPFQFKLLFISKST